MSFKRAHDVQLDRVVKLYLVSKFVGALYFVYPIFYQFASQTITPVEVGLFFSINSLCNFIADIPTSILADKYSRKSITLVGATLLTIAPWVILQAHSFTLFILAAILYGLGGACMNGALEALIYDHKNVSKTTFRRVNALEMTCGQAGILVSAAVGGTMFVANHAVPFLAQILAGLIWLVTLAYIQEQNKVDYTKSQVSYQRHLVQSLRHLLATSYLRVLVLMGVTFSVMLGMCIQFVNEAAMIEHSIGPATRGLLIAGAGFMTILMLNTFLLRLLKTDARRILYMALGALAAYSFMGLGILSLFLAGYVLWSCLNATSSFIRLIIHDRIPGSHRATIMSSFKGLAVLIGLGGSSATGLLIQWAHTPRAAYAVFGLITLFVLVPCALWLLAHHDRSAIA
ncbi:MAG TPA: MFS transporter [Candidatus Chromulinivoraceae bacterium]|nr:MFS transporter [Candidatus Chromulinivoraceae bacterium]